MGKKQGFPPFILSWSLPVVINEAHLYVLFIVSILKCILVLHKGVFPSSVFQPVDWEEGAVVSWGGPQCWRGGLGSAWLLWRHGHAGVLHWPTPASLCHSQKQSQLWRPQPSLPLDPRRSVCTPSKCLLLLMQCNKWDSKQYCIGIKIQHFFCDLLWSFRFEKTIM